MQNWNQWQLPAGTVTPMPQPPVGYAAPGSDPTAMMQTYMQYYNQPAPSGYTAEQWAAAQQQCWSQWQQWQQQYQQWQAQYGEKYQETMKQLGLAGQTPILPIVQPPPLPKEDVKPPLPPNSSNPYQFTNMPPPHQNNLPLFPTKQTSNSAVETSVPNISTNPPLPPGQPPLPPDSSANNGNAGASEKRPSNTVCDGNSAKKMKIEDEELTEAEKTFDAQFKQWEEQFNKWKEQNANHPDKTQYKQYEAKWTTWREKLIERREQMRKKREQQKQAAAKVEAEKNKQLSGDDKILNILSSTENQGLINNLLGIGKSLGLTGKQNTAIAPPPPPPPATNPSIQLTSPLSSSSQITVQATAQSQMSGTNSILSSSSGWNNQQWMQQSSTSGNSSFFPGLQPPPTAVPPVSNSTRPTQVSQNFSQPPPNFQVPPNFSLPPPGFPNNDTRLPQMQMRPPAPGNSQGRPPFLPNDSPGNEHQAQSGSNNFGNINQQRNFGMNEMSRHRDGPADNFSRDTVNKSFPDQQPDSFAPRNDNFKFNDERSPQVDQFRREDRNFQDSGNNTFNRPFGNDRFGPGGDYHGPPDDRFGSGNDRFGSGNNRGGSGPNRFGNDRFGVPSNDRFGQGTDRGEANNDRFNERFGSNDQFGPGDKHDNFTNTPRNFNRNNQFQRPDELAPELKKLMEKRKAAMDVFRPSFLDSDKGSNVGSLSESFKKITGDSPFIKSTAESSLKDYPGTKSGGFGPRAVPNFGPSGSLNFRFPGNEFRPQGPEFGPPRGPGFSHRNVFDPRNAKLPVPFRGSSDYDQRLEKDIDSRVLFFAQKLPDTIPPDFKSDMNNLDTLGIGNSSIGGKPKDMIDNNERKRDNCGDSGLHQSKSESRDGETGKFQHIDERQNFCENKEENHVTNDDLTLPMDIIKKPEALPFMGENDPKPEDLNMEPPPELPNLSPLVSDGVHRSETFDAKGPPLRPFSMDGELFGPRSPFDGRQGPRGMPFGPVGPLPFGPRGPNDIRFPPLGPRNNHLLPFNAGPNPHSLRGPGSEQFSPRGPPAGPFDAGPGHRPFGLSRPFDGQFDNRGPDNFPNPSERLPPPRRSNEAVPSQGGQNEPPFGPRGPKDAPFGLRGPKDVNFGPRGFSDRPFDNQAPNFDSQVSRNPTEVQFGNRPGIGDKGIDEFRSRDTRADSMPDAPYSESNADSFRGSEVCDKYTERTDLGMRDVGSDPARMNTDNNDRMRLKDVESGRSHGPNEARMPPWRQPFSNSPVCDVDQRFRRDNNIIRDTATSNTEESSSFTPGRQNLLPDKMRPDSQKDSLDRPGSSSSADFKSTYRPMDNRQSQSRCSVNEFCIEKQFNYNHGGTSTEKKPIEYVPAKVIDYAHIPRTPIQDTLTPVQCFDYGHGNLIPAVPDCEAYTKRDFRNWEESEQNLKEYTERIRRYENFAGPREFRDSRRSADHHSRREFDRTLDDRKYEGERWERESYREKDRIEERLYDRMSERDRDMRYQNDRSSNKERHQERTEFSLKETREYDKDNNRSKGSINWQDTSSKNTVEAKPQDISVSESKHNVVDSPPKTLELAKTPNCTMVDDLLSPPGRQNRPPKIAIILRGPPGSGKSFVAKLIKDKEVEQGGSAPRILSLDDYFLVEKEIETKDDSGKKVETKEMIYEYEEAMEQSYTASLVKAFKKNITDGFFNFIILDCINEKITDYEEMWSFAKTKGFKVYVCEMEMDLQICMNRNIHNRTEDEINRIIDYFEPTPSYHQKLDVNSMLQDEAIEDVQMEDIQATEPEATPVNEDSQDSQEDPNDALGVSKWERMEAEDKLDRLDGLAKKKNEGKVQTMQDFLQVPDYYNMEDTSGKKRVRWADLEERKEQEKMRAVGFVVGHTNWDRMMDPTKGGSALTRTKFFTLF